MNKLKFIFGACVAVAFAACSDEPNAAGGDNGTPDVDGDVAYMTINIKDVNNPTGRATSNSYEYGTDEENKVYNAKFLFFDANKNFLLQANIWNGGKPNETTPAENIEYFGNNVLVLENLKKTGYPKYMITVLNAPASLQPVVGATNMDDVRNLLCDVVYGTGTNGDDGKEICKFVMSTTSYGTATSRGAYFANELVDGNFKKEPYPAADDAPVVVYVERLAAKVRVNVASAIENDKEVFTEGEAAGKTGYRVPVSVSGNPNDQGGDNEGVTDVYITFEGWGLSNYEPASYLSKNLDVFTSTSLGSNNWNWNAPQSFRSYWAASPNYGQASPALVKNTYYGLDGVVGEGALYLPETTNTFANVQSNGLIRTRNVACVMMKSVVRDGNGKALDIVLYQGINYLRNSFVAYGLQALQYNDKLNVYTREVVSATDPDYKDGYKYTQIQKEMVVVKEKPNTTTGVVNLALSDEAESLEFFKKEGDAFVAMTKDDVNDVLAEFTKDSPAVASTDGAQYYTIPIEHYATAKPSTTAVKQEGEYGVVRNHIYDVNITKISRLGSGVYNPGSEDEPGEPLDPEDPNSTYYLSAQINILSWKVVKQNVEL